MKQQAAIQRTTKETNISATWERNPAVRDIETGIGFFDHMLTALSFHAGLGLTLKVVGDLAVDAHHTVEDTGIVLGLSLAELLDDKKGIARFAEASIPMDEALARAAVDISGRPFLLCQANWPSGSSGAYDYSLTEEFLRAFCQCAGITLHVEVVYGQNGHHMTEALFKAVAYALRRAMAPVDVEINSTKGTLG